MTDSPQSKELHRFELTTAAAPVNVEIAGSRFFRKFVVHIVGVEVGQTVDILASLDGVNYPILLDDVATTAAGAGVIFEFAVNSPMRGGLKIVFANTTADGKVYVVMSDNPSARRITG